MSQVCCFLQTYEFKTFIVDTINEDWFLLNVPAYYFVVLCVYLMWVFTVMIDVVLMIVTVVVIIVRFIVTVMW
jgi:hypothetical protein